MFNQGSKLAVLESKLNMYEELSREMLDKLESAVDKISEGNNRIATILAKHDERIDQSVKSDQLIIKMVEDLKDDSQKNCHNVSGRLDNLERKVEEITKFRWIIAGALIITTFIFSQSSLVIDILTPQTEPAKVEATR
jgi:uncharacterized coiled-coil DUF342 family protein